MKEGIHPTYHANVQAKCTCGATYDVGSTIQELSTEVCSACHPFYTGKSNIRHVTGRVDRFKAKLEKASQAKAPKAKDESAETELVSNAEGDANVVETKKPARKKASKK